VTIKEHTALYIFYCYEIRMHFTGCIRLRQGLSNLAPVKMILVACFVSSHLAFAFLSYTLPKFTERRALCFLQKKKTNR